MPAKDSPRLPSAMANATVLDDFPVISMATICNPIPLKLMQIGGGQRYFYRWI